MPAKRRSPVSLLLLALLLLAGAGVGVVLLLRGEPRDRGDAIGPTARVSASAAPVQDQEVQLAREVPEGVVEAEREHTSVLWPLEVELELLAAARLPMLDGGQPTAQGRGAELAGSMLDGRGNGVPAEVHFVAGPNQGRVLYANADGRFGASDLYPGLSLVDIRHDRILKKRREVRLRRGAVTELHTSDFRPASAYGTVRDGEGAPIVGAEVRFDGQLAITDPEGGFYIPEISAGKVVVEVEAEGFSPLREEQHISTGTTYTVEKFSYVLRRGATLEISLPDPVGGPGDAYVIIYPTKTNVARTFPWYQVNPVRMRPGGTRTVEGLPAGMVSVRVFHGGAIASPQEKAVNLRAGDVHQVAISLRPAPVLTGVVRRDGKPVPGATVRLEAPDRTATTLAFFRESSWYLESEILAPIPPAVQEVTTDPLGRFVLTAWSDLVPVRWLEAHSPDGEAWAGRLVGAADEEVALDLEPWPPGSGVLTLHTNQRRQGLDVDVTVNGARRDPLAGHPSWEAIRIGGLEPGTWRVRASWRAGDVVPATIVEIPRTGGAEVHGVLPQEALEGQDRDTWKRAGRAFPER